MNKTNNRFALVYDHTNISGWLKRVQMSDSFEPFPDSVQVGDFFRGQPIVALAVDMDDFAHVLQDENTLCEQGKQRLMQLQPLQQWRYYTLFRFYIVEPQSAATVEEKVAIALVGETQTTRVVGHSTPDALDTERVWEYLSQFETPDGTVINGGLLDGITAERFRSLDMIDTKDPRRQSKDWQPMPAMLIENPCPTVTVSATPA